MTQEQLTTHQRLQAARREIGEYNKVIEYGKEQADILHKAIQGQNADCANDAVRYYNSKHTAFALSMPHHYK